MSIYYSSTEIYVCLKWIKMPVENTVKSNPFVCVCVTPGITPNCLSLNVLTFKSDYTYLIYGKVKYLVTRVAKLIFW